MFKYCTVRINAYFFGAATYRWILQHLHSKTVLDYISAFPNKCTIKKSFQTADT
jgi:hypothetical protein